MLFLLSLLVLTLILSILEQKPISAKGKMGALHSLSGGTRDYSDETYMGGEPEFNASRDVYDAIYGLFPGT